MTTDEMIAFIEPYCRRPICKEWKPSEYDLKYRFKDTPAGKRKLEAVKAKEDGKLCSEYDKQLLTYNRTLAIIDTIGNFPTEIRDLFFHTVEWNVKTGLELRERARKMDDALFEKYGKRPDGEFRDTPYNKGRTWISWDFETYYGTDGLLHWRPKSANRTIEDICKFVYGYGTFDLEELLNGFVALEKASKEAAQFPCPYDAIVTGFEKLFEIVRTMQGLLGGEPERVEREADWGVGGHYNGIICRGTKRVSMKSFFAGGYNIQRLHIRCKCTLLKENA